MQEDPFREVIEMAMDALVEMERLSKRMPFRVNVRVGIAKGIHHDHHSHRHHYRHHSINRLIFYKGEVVAGVLGKKRLCYDIVGEAASMAARMAAYSSPSRIHIPYPQNAIQREPHCMKQAIDRA